MKKEHLIYTSSLAATVSIAFTVVITILAELLSPLKDWLKSMTGHHWTTKSIASIAVYAVFLFLFYLLPHPSTSTALRKSLYGLFITVLVGFLALLLFYSGHYWGVW